jgi:hypothetical protein
LLCLFNALNRLSVALLREYFNLEDGDFEVRKKFRGRGKVGGFTDAGGTQLWHAGALRFRLLFLCFLICRLLAPTCPSGVEQGFAADGSAEKDLGSLVTSSARAVPLLLTVKFLGGEVKKPG